MSFHKIKEYTKQGKNSYLLNYGSLKEREIVSKGTRRSKGYLIIPKEKRGKRGEKNRCGGDRESNMEGQLILDRTASAGTSLIPVYHHLSQVILILILRSSRCFLKFPCFFYIFILRNSSCHFNRIMKGNTFLAFILEK